MDLEPILINIRVELAKRKMSISDLATKSGIRKATLYDFMGGKSEGSIPTLITIADAIGVSVATLFDGVERKVTKSETTDSISENPEFERLKAFEANILKHGGPELLEAMTKIDRGQGTAFRGVLGLDSLYAKAPSQQDASAIQKSSHSFPASKVNRKPG